MDRFAPGCALLLDGAEDDPAYELPPIPRAAPVPGVNQLGEPIQITLCAAVGTILTHWRSELTDTLPGPGRCRWQGCEEGIERKFYCAAHYARVFVRFAPGRAQRPPRLMGKKPRANRGFSTM